MAGYGARLGDHLVEDQTLQRGGFRVWARARTWMTIWLSVSVPVLSEHSTVMPAISSIAVKRVTIAPCADSCREPSASVVVLRAARRPARIGAPLAAHGALYCVWA